jgi:hypothetical protein
MGAMGGLSALAEPRNQGRTSRPWHPSPPLTMPQPPFVQFRQTVPIPPAGKNLPRTTNRRTQGNFYGRALPGRVAVNRRTEAERFGVREPFSELTVVHIRGVMS